MFASAEHSEQTFHRAVVASLGILAFHFTIPAFHFKLFCSDMYLWTPQEITQVVGFLVPMFDTWLSPGTLPFHVGQPHYGSCLMSEPTGWRCLFFIISFSGCLHVKCTGHSVSLIKYPFVIFTNEIKNRMDSYFNKRGSIFSYYVA